MEYIAGAIIILFIISAIIAIIWSLIENKKKREYEQYKQWKQNSRQQQESIQNYEQSRSQQQNETPNYKQYQTNNNNLKKLNDFYTEKNKEIQKNIDKQLSETKQEKTNGNYSQISTYNQDYYPGRVESYQQPQPRTNYQQPRTQQQNYQQFFPYQKKYLLTRNEYNFYTRLKLIANRYNLQILTKIRLADLVETKKNLSYADSNAYFNKIRSKHVDFALVDNMRVVVLIELDDSSHKYQSRIERDIFVDDVLQRCGYIIIHTYGDTNQIDYTASNYRKSTCGQVT